MENNISKYKKVSNKTKQRKSRIFFEELGKKLGDIIHELQ